MACWSDSRLSKYKSWFTFAMAAAVAGAVTVAGAAY
jgi:hypothetical protein